MAALIIQVKSIILAASRYHAALSVDNFVPITEDNIVEYDMLPFNRAGDVLAVAGKMIDALKEDRKAEEKEERLVLDLQAVIARGTSCHCGKLGSMLTLRRYQAAPAREAC